MSSSLWATEYRSSVVGISLCVDSTAGSVVSEKFVNSSRNCSRPNTKLSILVLG